MPCRNPDILLEAFLIVMVATILQSSLFLGRGLLLACKRVHTSRTPHARNHHKRPDKRLESSATRTTCRLALLVLLLLCGNNMTSAKLRKPQKPQLQTYSEDNRTDVMQNAIILTGGLGMERNAQKRCKLHKWKTSRYLRKIGHILQYKIQLNDPIPLSPDNSKEPTNSSGLKN